MLYVRSAVRVDLAYLGLFLVLIYLLWGRIAQIVYGLSTYQLHRTVEDFVEYAIGTPDGQTMLLTGTLIGGGDFVTGADDLDRCDAHHRFHPLPLG